MLVKSEVLIVALTAIPLISSAPLLLAQPRQNNDVKLETTNDIQAQIKRLLKSESKDVSRIKVSTKNVMEMGLRQAAAISQSIYCSTIQERKWDCGKACQIVPDMQIQWTHGDNREIPYSTHLSNITLRCGVANEDMLPGLKPTSLIPKACKQS